ncbi:response regulator transcription factor [Pseudomonas sp. GD03944]|uniref:response regulator transcription factor n=1 Tax=Pseudomonas sp. GD03944 TaxID=2975409 RepID=UPI00244B4020|nr:response regulator transcription factor [Pseudomonas sp. GD03944]MDH1265000.1 response regulator transcription factor [Pseudomonas sp. GD03944]
MDTYQHQVKLLIVDDDPFIVEELSEFLSANGYPCVASQSTAHARELFDNDPQIGIVLCDLHMPEMDGISLVHELERIAGDGRPFEAIIFTGQAESRDVIAAMRAGVADFYQKPIDTDEVLIALKRLEQNLSKRLMDYQQLGQLNQKLQFLADSLNELHHDVHRMRGNFDKAPGNKAMPQEETVAPPFDQLSPRQLEVARLIGKGMTNYQISCELGITENTVKLYVSQVLRLTHMHNRTQLALALSPTAGPTTMRLTAH